MKVREYIKIFVFLMVITTIGYSQEGPTIPCPDCIQEFTKPIPYEGSWFNPEQSGSGFLFDVQNNILLGYYFGYDADGKPDWALFSGQLQDAADEGGLWKVTADLQKFNGGNCLNCGYSAPEQNESLGEIEVVFNRLSHASFSVNGGAVQNIVPLYFGYSFVDLPNVDEQEVLNIPELEGWWTVFIDFNFNIPDQYTYSNYMVKVRKGSISADQELRFPTILFPNAPEALDAGTIECSNESINNLIQPTCIYEINLFANESYVFKINLGNISSNRIYGETSNGDTIELLRTSSDLCISPNNPEDCVNTGIFDYLD